MGLPGGSESFTMLLRLFLLLMIGRAAAQETYPAPGWQKLAAFRRTQKWPHNFCQVRFSYIRDKFFHFARYCKLVNLIHRDRIAYVRLKIFVRIQTFRRRPFAASRNFCHPALWNILSGTIQISNVASYRVF